MDKQGFLDKLKAVGTSEDEDSAPYMVYCFNQIYRKYFGETYRQCLDIWQKKLDNIGGTPILSMGMSASFEAAIMEGATMVRVGGALFRA